MMSTTSRAKLQDAMIDCVLLVLRIVEDPTPVNGMTVELAVGGDGVELGLKLSTYTPDSKKAPLVSNFSHCQVSKRRDG